MKIASVHAREILDSRGIPTVETKLTLDSNHSGKGAVPSGASTGTMEAFELRDGDPTRYQGKGVQKAVRNVNEIIAREIAGKDFPDQRALDTFLKELDGTTNKSKHGGNAILSVSLAFLRATATAANQPPYRFLQSITHSDESLPPQLEILIMEGGKHGSWATDIQEYMIVPRRELFPTVAESVQAGSEIFWATYQVLLDKGYSTGVGFEGAFCPREIRSNEEAFEVLLAGIEKAGYTPQEEIVLAIDAAASEFHSNNLYNLKREGKQLSSDDWLELQLQWCRKYPIWSLEDTLDEEDWESWKKLTAETGGYLQIVGDDLLTTNTQRIQRAIDTKAANAVIIKINQIGTVTETLDAISLAESNGMSTIISHRAGETNDDFIADLVMGTVSWQTKFGGPDRGERLAKYNRLMEIEQEMRPIPASKPAQAVHQAF